MKPKTMTPPDKDELDEILGYLNMKMPLPTTANEGKQRVAALQEAKQAINHLIAKERLEELRELKTKKLKGAGLIEMKWIDKRIATLEQSLKEQSKGVE